MAATVASVQRVLDRWRSRVYYILFVFLLPSSEQKRGAAGTLRAHVSTTGGDSKWERRHALIFPQRREA